MNTLTTCIMVLYFWFPGGGSPYVIASLYPIVGGKQISKRDFESFEKDRKFSAPVFIRDN